MYFSLSEVTACVKSSLEPSKISTCGLTQDSFDVVLVLSAAWIWKGSSWAEPELGPLLQLSARLRICQFGAAVALG
jgi:hypothetical protein